jgi:hypothetical protein
VQTVIESISHKACTLLTARRSASHSVSRCPRQVGLQSFQAVKGRCKGDSSALPPCRECDYRVNRFFAGDLWAAEAAISNVHVGHGSLTGKLVVKAFGQFADLVWNRIMLYHVPVCPQQSAVFQCARRSRLRNSVAGCCTRAAACGSANVALGIW